MKLLTQLSVISYLDRKKPQVLNYDLSAVGILAAHTVCLMRKCFALALWFPLRPEAKAKHCRT